LLPFFATHSVLSAGAKIPIVPVEKSPPLAWYTGTSLRMEEVPGLASRSIGQIALTSRLNPEHVGPSTVGQDV
jgi:hypothetical protein